VLISIFVFVGRSIPVYSLNILSYSTIASTYLVWGISLLDGIPVRRSVSSPEILIRTWNRVVSMNRRIGIGATMAISIASNVHGKTRMRLNDLVVLRDFIQGHSAISVVAGFSEMMG
jgi:hypothetical protein